MNNRSDVVYGRNVFSAMDFRFRIYLRLNIEYAHVTYYELCKRNGILMTYNTCYCMCDLNLTFGKRFIALYSRRQHYWKTTKSCTENFTTTDEF